VYYKAAFCKLGSEINFDYLHASVFAAILGHSINTFNITVAFSSYSLRYLRDETCLMRKLSQFHVKK